jgi:hypothetical protein
MCCNFHIFRFCHVLLLLMPNNMISALGSLEQLIFFERCPFFTPMESTRTCSRCKHLPPQINFPICSPPWSLLLFHEREMSEHSTSYLSEQNQEWSNVSAVKRHSLLIDSSLGGVSMHALTQEVIRGSLMGDFKVEALSSVFKVLAKKMESYVRDKPETYFVGRRYARHVKVAASYFLHGVERYEATVQHHVSYTCSASGIYHESAGLYVDALEMYQKSLAIWRSVHGGEQHPDIATSYNNIASVYAQQGKLDAALEMYQKGLAIMRSVHGGEQHPDIIHSRKLIRFLESLRDDFHEKHPLLQAFMCPGNSQSGDSGGSVGTSKADVDSPIDPERAHELRITAASGKYEAVCAQCGKGGKLLKCSACKSVAYCGKECQAAAWKGGHKKKCKKR